MKLKIVVLTLLIVNVQGVPWKTSIVNVPKKFLGAPANCNPHNYPMILNSPAICGSDKQEVFLLILVRSTPHHTLRRESIRKTWGSVNEVQQKRIKVAFLFGKKDTVSNKQLEKEHIKYHDILQESFKEAYSNLDLKTVMAWKWAITFCSNSLFVIVCNDETFVDIFKTVSSLKRLVAAKEYETFYGCWMAREGTLPYRNVKHKIGVSWEDYPGEHYPAFCNGNGYVASLQIIRKLYNMALNTPTFMPDDVWCGVLAAKLNLVISDMHDEFPISPHAEIIKHYLSFDQYNKSKLLFYPLDRQFYTCEVCVSHYLWQRIMLYNNSTRTIKKSVDLMQKMSLKIFPRVRPLFYISIIVNVVFLVNFHYSRHRKIPICLSIFNIFILIIS